MVLDFQLGNIDQAAQFFLNAIKNRKVIAFHAGMGAGKTTFIHAVCNALHVKDVISSPTFSIINEYKSGDGETVYHIDLYRLKDEREAIAAGVEESLCSGSLCLVEWPDKAPGIFPEDTVHCYLTSLTQHERKLQINL